MGMADLDKGVCLMNENNNNWSIEKQRLEDTLAEARAQLDDAINANEKNREMIQAAKKAQCDEFIRKLPSGYDTRIGGDFTTLSEGECQLLAIARTIMT